MRGNKHAPHLPETKAKARELRRKGLTYREIGEAVGASPQTILNWCASPARREHIRERERARKQKYTRPCIDCGGATGYGKHGDTRRCNRCHRIFISKTKKWTRDNILTAIHRWNEEYGKPPSASDWNTTIARERKRASRDPDRYPSPNSVYGPYAPFNSWADAIEAAGFPRPESKARGGPHRRYWTEERIIEALHAHAENGYGPLMMDWVRTAPDHPTGGSVAMIFGSWSKALEAAGLEPNPRSKGGSKPKNQATTPALTDERVAFVERCMENKVLKHYITRLMWKKWGYSSEKALKNALVRRGIVEKPGWQYRFNRQLTQEEIEEGFSL